MGMFPSELLFFTNKVEELLCLLFGQKPLLFLDFSDNANMESHGTKFHSLQAQPHRALETNLSQWEDMEQRLHSDTAGPHGIQETIVMHWKLMEPRQCHWEEASVHCETAQPGESQDSTVTPWDLEEPSLRCKHSGTHGSQETIVMPHCHCGALLL